MDTADAWLQWFLINWHWLIVLICLILFSFGFIGFIEDSDGDLFVF